MSRAVLRVGGSGPLAVRLAPLVVGAQECLSRNIVPASGRRPAYLRAGGGYPDPWTRDAAINTWQAAAWLAPQVAADTLAMVCEPDGSAVVWDDQWWDQASWLLGARQLALTTGDAELAARGFRVGTATVARLDARCRDEASGLYRGPAVMADGITGYPPELVEPGNPSSFVLDHPATHSVFSLSTNALYVLALAALADLAEAAGVDPVPLRKRSASQAVRVRDAFREPSGELGYLLVHGRLTSQQEALGIALAVLAGVVTSEEARSLLAGAHRTPYGVPAVWPPFPGIPDGRFGRHGAALWPMVTGVWAQAVAAAGDASGFGAELAGLCSLFEGSGGDYYEVYSPLTGAPDGGWQIGQDWRSEPDQTWSATTFIGTLLHGLAGLRPTPEGLIARPCLPPGADGIVLLGVPWRGTSIDVTLHGSGTVVTDLWVNGGPFGRGALPRAAEDARSVVLPARARSVDVFCSEEEER